MAEAVLDETVVEEVLRTGSLELEGRLVYASNATFLARVTAEGVSVPCVYKPVVGERPLWDFPHGTLAARERAARVVSEAGGWHVVPPTVLREDTRFGLGMAQQWVEVDADSALVDVVDEGECPEGWIPVLEAEDEIGRSVLLVHAEDERLRDLAVLDAVINNADRKGGHVLPTTDGSLFGCDHGVTFHEDEKLRTVLWGWAGQRLREQDRVSLRRLTELLDAEPGVGLAELLSAREVRALRRRVERLLSAGRMPAPARSWRVIPWPAM